MTTTPEHYVQEKAAKSGSSFYYSFMFLPPPQRRAITALYAFCREVDDVVDEVTEDRVARLVHMPPALAEALNEEGAFRHTIRSFAIPEKRNAGAILGPGNHIAWPFRMHARPKPSIAWHEHERERGGNGKAPFHWPPPAAMP